MTGGSPNLKTLTIPSGITRHEDLYENEIKKIKRSWFSWLRVNFPYPTKKRSENQDWSIKRTCMCQI